MGSVGEINQEETTMFEQTTATLPLWTAPIFVGCAIGLFALAILESYAWFGAAIGTSLAGLALGHFAFPGTPGVALAFALAMLGLGIVVVLLRVMRWAVVLYKGGGKDIPNF